MPVAFDGHKLGCGAMLISTMPTNGPARLESTGKAALR